MDRLISEQAVIDRLTRWYSDMLEIGEEKEDLVDVIKSIPPAEPKWIPVSERLPESSGVYIVTREFNDGFECVDLTDACYFDGTSTWHNDNRINHDREYVDKKIKAWMPLPAPFEPQESEG